MKAEKSTAEFIIVGAGLAGLLAGIELRRMNVEVIILERSRSIQRPVCGEYLSPEGVKLLEDLGFSSLLSAYEKVLGMTLSTPTWKTIDTAFPGERFGVSLNRQRFQTDLLHIFQKLGGSIHFNEAILSAEETTTGYSLKTRDREFSAEFLIGADGRSSRVAKLLGMKAKDLEEKRSAIHVYLRPKKTLPRKGQMHILPMGAYVGINPVNELEVNFSIVASADSVLLAGGALKFLNYWIAHSPLLRDQFHPVQNEEIKTTFPITRDAIDIHQRRAVLIGDASGFIDPLTGEGMTTAIKTVLMLTQELRTSDDRSEAFGRYAQRRKVDLREKENLNRAFQIIIRKNWACEVVHLVLSSSKRLRDSFIGIVGNIFTPSEGLQYFFKSVFQERSSYVTHHRRPVRISRAPLLAERDHGSPAKDVA